jgi:hypothetical protein
MALLLAFIVFAVVGQIANVAACLALERFYPGGFIIPVFFGLWVAVFWLSWRLALRLTESRSTVSADQQQLLVILTTAMHAPMIA